jgi:manganese/zinc/iron transport system permease protein
LIPWDWEIDGWIVVAGSLAAIASSILGCLLLLRRMSLIGDAISHSVLPGIAAAVLVFEARSSVWVFASAAATGLFAVWLAAAIRRYGGVEDSAATGIVFTSMFALGLVMVLQGESHVDLDPACILFGNLETSILDMVDTVLGPIPKVVLTLLIACSLNAFVLIVLFKEWRITSFDPEFAKSQGFSDSLFHYLLSALVALTCIAAFEAVGTVLVVAMLVVPAATAFLLCRSLSRMIFVAMGVSIAVAVMGHFGAIAIPKTLGLKSFNSSAMMAVTCGAALTLAILFGRHSGVIAQWLRSHAIKRQILQDDILALLYRNSERYRRESIGVDGIDLTNAATTLKRPAATLKTAFGLLVQRNLVVEQNQTYLLTEQGSRLAQNLVRSHRLWEQFLSIEANLPEDKVHPHAERWEHVTNSTMRVELDAVTGKSSLDPHGREIPPES